MDRQTKLEIRKLNPEQLSAATENNLWFLLAEQAIYTRDAPGEIFCFLSGILMSVPVKDLIYIASYERKGVCNREEPSFGYFYLYNSLLLALEHNDFDDFFIAVPIDLNPSEVANYVSKYPLHHINKSVVRKFKIDVLLQS